jgi:hypothetical protein
LHTRSSEEKRTIAAVAVGEAALPAATNVIPQALAGPVALDTLPAVDHNRRFSQGGAGTMAIERDQRIAQPLGLGSPTWRWAREPPGGGKQNLKSGERFTERADVAALVKPQCKDRGGDDAILPIDGELHDREARAQGEMLAPGRVEKDVLYIGERGNEEPWAIGRWSVEGSSVELQRGGSGLGQPDRVTLPSRELRINESTPIPTPRRRRDGPATG